MARPTAPKKTMEVTVAIVRLTQPSTGRTVFLPMGQERADTFATLVRDDLIERVSSTKIVADVTNIRVLAFMLTQNEEARRLGKPQVFTELPCDLVEEVTDKAH